MQILEIDILTLNYKTYPLPLNFWNRYLWWKFHIKHSVHFWNFYVSFESLILKHGAHSKWNYFKTTHDSKLMSWVTSGRRRHVFLCLLWSFCIDWMTAFRSDLLNDWGEEKLALSNRQTTSPEISVSSSVCEVGSSKMRTKKIREIKYVSFYFIISKHFVKTNFYDFSQNSNFMWIRKFVNE